MFTGDWHLFLEEVHKWRRDRVRAPAMPPAKALNGKAVPAPQGGRTRLCKKNQMYFHCSTSKTPWVVILRAGMTGQAHKGEGHKGIDARGNTHAVAGGLGLLQQVVYLSSGASSH